MAQSTATGTGVDVWSSEVGDKGTRGQGDKGAIQNSRIQNFLHPTPHNASCYNGEPRTALAPPHPIYCWFY
ncbi:hypothetical protein [Chroococcidiopsis cubana]|uniref:hypothetical protein n=1 Tax=Chroococcidiopsis cubana TaxID=171392 RepID=UPI002ACE518B|nr:hypothetical protein [Chroococcidiopsis cubana]